MKKPTIKTVAKRLLIVSTIAFGLSSTSLVFAQNVCGGNHICKDVYGMWSLSSRSLAYGNNVHFTSVGDRSGAVSIGGGKCDSVGRGSFCVVANTTCKVTEIVNHDDYGKIGLTCADTSDITFVKRGGACSIDTRKHISCFTGE